MNIKCSSISFTYDKCTDISIYIHIYIDMSTIMPWPVRITQDVLIWPLCFALLFSSCLLASDTVCL